MVYGPQTIRQGSGYLSAEDISQFIDSNPQNGQGLVTIDAVQQYDVDSTGQLDVGITLSALSAMVSALGGGTIKLRPGVYLARTPVILGDSVILEGSGKNKTTLKQAPNMNRLIYNAGSQTGIADNNLIIRDMTLDFNGTNQSINGNYMLLNWTNWCLIERCRFINPRDTFIVWAYDSNHYNNTNNRVVDCEFDGSNSVINADLFDFGSGTDGIIERCKFINGSSGANGMLSCAVYKRLTIRDCIFTTSQMYGLSIQGCEGLKISGCTFDTCTGFGGLQITPWTTIPPNIALMNATVSDCYFTSNTLGCTVQGDATVPIIPTSIVFHGCTFYRNVQAGLALQTAKLVEISACQFDGNNTGATSYGAIHTYTGASNASQNISVKNCQFYDTQGSPTQTIGLSIQSSNGQSWNVQDCEFTSAATPISQIGGSVSGLITKNNAGYNPLSKTTNAYLNTSTATICSPAVAAGSFASGTTYTNVSGVDVEISFSSGTISLASKDGLTANTLLASGVIYLPAGSTIAITWSVQPTWQWYGL